jgi:hypothetical protein
MNATEIKRRDFLMATTLTGAAAIAAPVGRLITSGSLPVGEFTPGMVLVDRYRVVGLIGRGEWARFFAPTIVGVVFRPIAKQPLRTACIEIILRTCISDPSYNPLNWERHFPAIRNAGRKNVSRSIG